MNIKACQGQKILMFAGLSGFLTVALGAFAAHGLRQMISPELIEVFKTGVQYQAWHTLAIIACGILLGQNLNESAHKKLVICALCFIIGIFCFSGSLYALAITGVKWFGPITPIGGIFFLVGWLMFMLAALSINKVKS